MICLSALAKINIFQILRKFKTEDAKMKLDRIFPTVPMYVRDFQYFPSQEITRYRPLVQSRILECMDSFHCPVIQSWRQIKMGQPQDTAYK